MHYFTTFVNIPSFNIVYSINYITYPTISHMAIFFPKIARLYMQNTKKSLGARIQEIRKRHKFTQAELAEILDIDPKHMSKIECGNHFPSFELLDKIALALNTPIVEFFYNEHLQDRQN